MYCIRKITEDLTWVGGNDRRLSLFEGVYPVPRGVSYNSYVLTDEKTVLFDTVDHAISDRFFENVAAALCGRPLDYLVIHHMEPDHSATVAEVLSRYPESKIVCNEKIAGMMNQFFGFDQKERLHLVKEGDSLSTGKHNLVFVMAPMVHWPEVMVSFDTTDGILFSADAFGTFGAINGALFADEVNFERDYLDEARRYYTNIVGKYGPQVQTLLKKAATLDIKMICPLHGFVWRKNPGDFIEKYVKWATYTPEENGVVIAYASIYGHTENAAEILSCRLREKGIPTVMFDVSVTHASEIVAAAFRFSHLVFAAPTYNAGIFVTMENLLHDIAAHNIQNRKVAFIENGSWAPTSGKLMREILEKCKNISFIDQTVSIRSSLTETGVENLNALAQTIEETFPQPEKAQPAGEIASNAFFKLSYGVFVLSVKDGDTDNGCIINTAIQITEAPHRIAFAVNRSNLTCEQLQKGKQFTLSILSTETTFETFQRFGFHSGRDTNKYEDVPESRAKNGVRYITEGVNAVLAGTVVNSYDYGTHILFVADVTEAFLLSDAPSATYQYYFDHIKPKPPVLEEKKGFVCKICGYIYEGDTLPADFICPLCKHGAEDFEPIG